MAIRSLKWVGMVFILISLIGVAHADGWDKHMRDLRDSLSTQIKAMEDAKQRVDETAGTLEAVDSYMYAAVNVVNLAKTIANYESKGHVEETNDLLSLVGKGYLPYWPGNPCNNWEPMKVLQASDGFSAGDLCLMVCPPDAYGDMGAGPAPTSYQLFIYGPDDSLERFGTVYMAGTNGTWCTAPHGVMYGIGFYCMSIKEHEEQEKKLEEYFKTHPDPRKQ
jgi:hypothetical protein